MDDIHSSICFRNTLITIILLLISFYICLTNLPIFCCDVCLESMLYVVFDLMYWLLSGMYVVHCI